MPLALRPSQRVRTLRLYEGSLYKEEKQELILKLPEIREASQEITDYLKTSNQSPLRIKHRTHTHHSAYQQHFPSIRVF